MYIYIHTYSTHTHTLTLVCTQAVGYVVSGNLSHYCLPPEVFEELAVLRLMHCALSNNFSCCTWTLLGHVHQLVDRDSRYMQQL